MSTQYIHFTEQEKEQARQTDIAQLLYSQGETLKRSGSEYEWKNGSQKVTIRGNLWFHQYEQQGGDAIDFVRRFYNKSYLCRDNDEAGQLANKRTSDALFLKGIQHELLVPLHKDWNENRLAAGDNAPHKDVCAEFFISEQQETNDSCQTLQL